MRFKSSLATIFVMLMAFVLLTLTGCPKKNPKDSGEEMKPVATPVPTPQPTPPPSRYSQEIDEATEMDQEPQMPALEDINFDYDRYALTMEAREILGRNALYLKRNMSVRVQIEGHCDERGTVEYNLALGQKRADSAREYLVSMGIDADRITTISYGEERPLDPGHSESAWAKNRRAHFTITSR